MAHTLFYAVSRGYESMSAVAMATELERPKSKTRKAKNGKLNNGAESALGVTKMSEVDEQVMEETETETDEVGGAKPIVQRTVFDLGKFDSVLLAKEIELPKDPANLHEAEALVGNDTAKLMKLIGAGLRAEVREKAYEDMTGFRYYDFKTKELGEPYNGNFADGKKTKLINDAVLTLAKLQGYHQDLEPDKKAALKEGARKFLRDNPAMIQSIQ